MVNNFTSICKSFSKSSENLLTPCTFVLVKKVSKSIRYSANRNEYKCSHCLTPFKHGKKFETEPHYKEFLILYYYTGLKLHCTFYPLYYT